LAAILVLVSLVGFWLVHLFVGSRKRELDDDVSGSGELPLGN
jgi:hypothetical protein